MVHNKIIFLDIDGVVNIPNYQTFDGACLENLYDIIRKTGAKIIVSSSWRTGNLEKTKATLEESGFAKDMLQEIIGETVRNWDFVKDKSYLKLIRGNEVGTWIDRNLIYPWHDNPDMDAMYRVNNEDGSFKIMNSNKTGVHFSYVILDDDTDFLLCQKDYFVNTDGIVGLTKQDAAKAIEILNKIDDVTKSQPKTKYTNRTTND